jgi:hypothetical protein
MMKTNDWFQTWLYHREKVRPMKSSRAFLAVIVLAALTLLLLAIPAAAQQTPVPTPILSEQFPNDRVIVACSTGQLDIYGSDNLGVGFYITSIRYSELSLAGPTVRNTRFGQITVTVTLQGEIRVSWFGGPYYATGIDDFDKVGFCPFAIPISSSPAPVGTPAPIGTPVSGTTTTTTSAIFATPLPSTVAGTRIVACGARPYVVQPGDNLFRISLRFNTTVSALAACNGITNPARIYVGQTIYVP